MVKLALEADLVLGPEPADQLQPLVGAAAAAPGLAARRLPVRRQAVADAEGRQQTALAQEIDGGALLGQQQRIAQAHRDHVHAELQPRGRAGQPGHGAHRLEEGLARDQAIGLPDGIDSPRLAGLDPTHVGRRPGEGKVGDAQADCYAHDSAPSSHAARRRGS